MEAFIQWTAWQMEKPAPYGLFHILMTFGLLAIAVTAAWLLRNTNEKQNRIVLGAVGIFLLLAEVYKIAFHMLHPDGWGFWGVFPFQLCSVPMYLSLICVFSSSRKFNSWLYECMFAVNMFGGIMAFLEPSGIQHEYVTLTLHAYIWHMMLIFLGLYLYMSKRACMDRGSYKKAAAVYLATCALAQTFNVIFGDRINCFYISLVRQSPLAVFKDIYAACGGLINCVLMIVAILLASAIVYYIGYGIRVLNRRKVKV